MAVKLRPTSDRIIILDMGGQYAHLLARRIRQLGVYSEILPSDTPIKDLKTAKGIIISGGPSSVYDKGSPKSDKKLFSLNIPILGLCYGHQLMAHSLKGKVHSGKTKEYGTAVVDIVDRVGIAQGLKSKEHVWMSHGDTVEKMPHGFVLLGSTSDCTIAAMGDPKRNFYGLQFHPEVTHTANGMKMLSNFVFKICRARKSWGIKSFVKDKIEQIRKEARGKNVLLLASGGVDSTVCFALLNKALGPKRVYGLHIDNGFMRKNESRNVRQLLERAGFGNFHVIDAERDFLSATDGITDPEKKRKAIGETFIRIQQMEVKRLGLNADDWLLGQGTIYPDTIETKGSRHAALIKTHHNRVQMVQELIRKGLVIEPIKELYKDEVRELGIKLGLPRTLVMRHPFPGPGLAVRCLCSGSRDIIENKVDIDTRINLIAAKYGAAASVLPVRSVGVQGDARTYRHPVAIKGKIDVLHLELLSTELTNKVKEINRVVYLISKSDITVPKLKRSYLTKERLDLLREADSKVAEIMEKYRHTTFYRAIWQFPVVLVPISFIAGETIILRPVESKEAMTARWARIPASVLKEIADELLHVNGIDAVFLDVTNKPPGTIEWE